MSKEKKWSADNYYEINAELDENHEFYEELGTEIVYGERVWVRDANGAWYLDFLSGYSANNFGHRHPRIIDAAKDQLDKLTLTARAFKTDKLEPFCQGLGGLTGKEVVLPMNTGAEGVESAIKISRKWGEEVKGVPKNESNIIVMDNNFHGRTTTIISFSDDESARDGFGPYTPGFRRVPYGDAAAIENALDDHTVAVLFEPIQGEAGVIVPPDGFIKSVRDVCTRENVLMVADEIQSGLGRTGKTFACDHEEVEPDLYIVGKALGGGIYPVSAVCGNKDVMGVLHPGEHGSTFGGNPLACAIGTRVVEMMKEGEYQKHAARMGEHMFARLEELKGHGVTEVRGKGLWAGIDIEPDYTTGKEAAKRLFARNVLAKDTHGQTLRFSPPLNIFPDEVDKGVDQLRDVLHFAKR